jgi:hypothetical protein
MMVDNRDLNIASNAFNIFQNGTLGNFRLLPGTAFFLDEYLNYTAPGEIAIALSGKMDNWR